MRATEAICSFGCAMTGLRGGHPGGIAVCGVPLRSRCILFRELRKWLQRRATDPTASGTVRRSGVAQVASIPSCGPGAETKATARRAFLPQRGEWVRDVSALLPRRGLGIVTLGPVRTEVRCPQECPRTRTLVERDCGVAGGRSFRDRCVALAGRLKQDSWRAVESFQTG